MDNATLVSIEFEKGSEVLKALEAAGIKVPVALWLHLSKYDDWRLVLSSPQFPSQGGRKSYEMVHKALDKAGKTSAWQPTLLLFGMSDPFIRALRRHFAKFKPIEGTRLTGLFADRFVDDGYVYRIQ